MSKKSTVRPYYKQRKFRIIGGIILLIIVLRLLLTPIVHRYVNNALANMDGYYGYVEDIDIALYRGAYKIVNIYLDKVDSTSGNHTPFFEAELIDLSVDWQALFDGKLSGELLFKDPVLRFTKDKSEIDEVQKDSSDFKVLLDQFMPLRVNRFEIENGTVQYIDSTSKPPVNIQMDRTHVVARNLTNVKNEDKLPSTVIADANVYGGNLHVDMKLDPLGEDPTFDLNAELKNTNLPELNDFFKAYGKFDVNNGSFGLYTEIAALEGKFKGYVKPVIKDLKVLGIEDREDNILRKLWEGAVGGAGMLLTNPKEDQVATKVPLEGTFKDTRADILYAVFDMLRNAFIQALQPSIDHEINIQSVYESEKEDKGLLKKIFGGKDKKEKDNRQKE